VTTNVDGYEGTYKTLEFSANKRYSNRWSMVASYSYTWTHEFGNNYFNNRFGTACQPVRRSSAVFPSNPNENTLNDFTNWNAKLSGTLDAGWDVRVTPVLKMQSGAPYGRFFVTRPGELNFGNQIILAEPIGTRRQETISVFDIRAEKQLRIRDRARVGLFVDVYNLTNANTAINVNWRSGASFEKATTVLPPRIAKFGVKFNW
jgi:hypothetical protein